MALRASCRWPTATQRDSWKRKGGELTSCKNPKQENLVLQFLSKENYPLWQLEQGALMARSVYFQIGSELVITSVPT